MTQGNEWKPIAGYEGLYEVNPAGMVRSLDRTVPGKWPGFVAHIRGKTLTPIVNQHGYLRVNLCGSDGKHRAKFIHQLVARAFIPNPNNYPQINHKDEDKTNNNADNLEWCDAKYNTNYGTHNARLSATMRRNQSNAKPVIGISLKTGAVLYMPSISEAERQYPALSKNAISKCCKGQRRHNRNFVWRIARCLQQKKS